MQLSKKEIAIVKSLAPRFTAPANAPDTYKALMRWWKKNNYSYSGIPIRTDGCENSIYGSPAGNRAFRAWHDKLHLEFGLDFSLRDELVVSDLQVRQARQLGFSEMGLLMLTYDTKGQVLWYYEHGEYIKNQAGYVEYCVNHGLDYALKNYINKE